MSVVAVMPIKLNNERLPGKNTKLLSGKPLLSHMLDVLACCSKIDNTYVYCSDPAICRFLRTGVEYLHRSRQLDLPTSNFTQIFEAFAESRPADLYVFAHATAPFVRQSTIERMIDSVMSGDYDSAFTAIRIQDFLWQDGRPLNFDATNLPRSQDLKPIYRETSGVYVFTKDVFLKSHRRIGNRPYIAEVSLKESVDINTAEDFSLAEALAGKEM